MADNDKVEVEVTDLKTLIALVKHQTELIEALEEVVSENHLEALEKISMLAEGGLGFSVYES